ncbi:MULTISPECIES: Scr1 family TA system antitoxin-like transcriptional regulator [unclassified Streptomyces]|uniref:Scr1 family TA system antitoxin-like transcriptional regulator n=1 Tax=unclassified Streptomyces TaxID=2593676 RepID=UPI002B1DC2AB|nr:MULTISPECIES: Scr1 family TA system antitoxin-like transcriptional regulator [unclassified Streptomyces]
MPGGAQRTRRAAGPLVCRTALATSSVASRVGNRAMARAQLTRILELSEPDHITVRVVPFDLEGFPWGSSTMAYVGGGVTKLDTVIRDVPTGAFYADAEEQLRTYRARFQEVRARALDPDRSREFIQRLAKEL